jgi:trk system potassium uptake protein TrkA
MYIIIVGAGRIGTPLIEMATESGHEVVVIESDEAVADRIADQYDCLVVNADATRMSTLDDANADEADALISTTDRDATNVMVCLLANKREIPTVVSVVHDPDHMDLFKEIGIHTMENPSRLISEHLFRSVVRPSIVDYLRIGEEAEVFEITIDDDAPIAGKTLRDAAADGTLRGEMLVVAVERGEGEPITPRGDTVLQPGDLVTVYSAEGATSKVTDIFGHYEDEE